MHHYEYKRNDASCNSFNYQFTIHHDAKIHNNINLKLYIYCNYYVLVLNKINKNEKLL